VALKIISTATATGVFSHYVNNYQWRSVATFTSAAFLVLVMITLLIYTRRYSNSPSKISTSVLKCWPELHSLLFQLDGIVMMKNCTRPKTPTIRTQPINKFNLDCLNTEEDGARTLRNVGSQSP
jgi:hypothetical protein